MSQRVNQLLFLFQTPLSMKAVVQAGWLMTVGIGNLIVVIFAEARFVENQVRISF